MKLITCTGYHGTGSSAITDLLREYNNVKTNSDYEIAFLYEYNGINDLFYHLIEKPIRNMSNEAIVNFWRLCKYNASEGRTMNYEIYFKHCFLKYTMDYIDDIGGNYYMKHFPSDFKNLSYTSRIICKIFTKLNHILQKTYANEGSGWTFSLTRKRKFYFHTLDYEDFIKKTRKYLERLFEEINQKEYLMIDQLVSSSTIDDCSRYFEDLKVILVDRDPRDIYLEEKYRWKGESLPSKNVEEYCECYRWMREMGRNKGKNILKIQFEDLVFHYSETVKKIEDFCKLDASEHIEKKKYFNPDISKNNCCLWTKYPNEKNNINFIEKNLSEFVYAKK